VCFVPPAFAAAAIALVDTCEALTEAQARTFIDNKHYAMISSEKRDAGAIESLKAERDLRVSRSESTAAIDTQITKALDPDDAEPGVRKVEAPTSFANLKTRRNLTVVPPT
jgi:hypothetical protein